MGDNKHTPELLKGLQALPLERKIGITATRIIEWYQHYQGKVYVSFSGGKDSTVLLHIARKLYPEIKAMFLDTGLEYPEIRQFVKTWDNVDWVRPDVSFKEVIENIGYPVISKEVAHIVRGYRSKPDGCCAIALGIAPNNGKYGRRYDFSRYKYLVDAPFKISDRCCDIMKKRPANKYAKKTGCYPIVATMTEESFRRRTTWIHQGCNAFNATHPISAPMSFWTEQDVLEYIRLSKLKIASVYGDICQDNGKLACTGCHRTGCVFCLFGIKSDKRCGGGGGENRIQRLQHTHPALWRYCVNTLKLREVMDYIGEPVDSDELF